MLDVVLELPFSREMESEADSVGLTLAARACVDVREAPAFWGRMAVLDAAPDEAVPELLSTHPAHHTRRENLIAWMPEAVRIREVGSGEEQLTWKILLKRSRFLYFRRVRVHRYRWSTPTAGSRTSSR